MVCPGACLNSRAYIIPAICVPCPACKSHGLSPSKLSSSNVSQSTSSSASSATNLPCKYRREIPMAICLHVLIFILTPNHFSLCFCMIFRIRSDVHCLLQCIVLYLGSPDSYPSSISPSIPPSCSFSSFFSSFSIASDQINGLNLSAFSVTDCTACQNGNTNHKYLNNNSPTSFGKYRWMIFIFPV